MLMQKRRFFCCIDNNGQTSYSDTECTGNDKHVRTIEQNAHVVTFEDLIELDENQLFTPTLRTFQ